MIGHARQIKYFKSVIKNNALSHAYLFTGPEKIGKKLFAEYVYTLINKRDELKKGDPDFKFISPRTDEGETTIPIKDMRDLKSFMSLKPYQGPYRVIVINDAERLTLEASNALLKMLEEPPPFSVILLISSIKGLLPQTVVSRCETVDFLPAEAGEVEEFLEGYKLSRENKEFLIKLSGGRLGLLHDIIDTDSIDNAKKSVDDLRNLLNKGVAERLIYAKKMYEGENYQDVTSCWFNWLYANMKNSKKTQAILKDLLELNKILSQSQFNHRLALENFLINL